jgi:hypothetical protein
MEANGGAANQVAAVAQIKGVLSCGCVKPWMAQEIAPPPPDEEDDVSAACALWARSVPQYLPQTCLKQWSSGKKQTASGRRWDRTALQLLTRTNLEALQATR